LAELTRFEQQFDSFDVAREGRGGQQARAEE